MSFLPRRLGAAVAVTALAVSLAACSGSASGGGSAAATDNNIEIWYRPGSLPTASVDGVAAAFPEAKIQLVKTPDVDTKLASALRTGKGVPDIAVANIFVLSPAASKFANVDDYGFSDAAGNYLDWKVKAAQDKDGRQIGIPIDIGPQGFFYREDVFKKAGLPTDPTEVAQLVSTWDGYRSTAQKIKAATGEVICDSAGSSILTTKVVGSGKYYYDNGQPSVDTPLNKEAFTSALQFAEDGLCLNAEPYSTDWSAGVAQNQLAGWVGPAYQAPLISAAGGDGKGKWRVTNPPGGPSSRIGSNLSVFQASSNPALATKIAIWMTNADNQSKGYLKDGLFPSTPASYDSPGMTAGDPYFGDQKTAAVLADVAKNAPVVQAGQESTIVEAAVNTTLTDAINNKQDPEAAWQAAVKKAG